MMFDCEIIRNLKKKIGIVPQTLLVSDGTKVCAGMLVGYPNQEQCHNCKDYYINNKIVQKENPDVMQKYNEARHAIHERDAIKEEFFRTGKPLKVLID